MSSGHVNANFCVYYSKNFGCTQKFSSFACSVHKMFELCGEDELSHNFTQFKLTIPGHDAGRMSFNDTCTIKEYPHVFPLFSRLVALALLIPVSIIPCEREFSVQN